MEGSVAKTGSEPFFWIYSRFSRQGQHGFQVPGLQEYLAGVGYLGKKG